MSQNTDSFPTPRGALSPDGVTAAAPQPHAFIATTGLYETPPRCGCGRLVQDAIHADPLGVPGYAGAKGVEPEPQGPTTEAEQRLQDVMNAYELGLEHGRAEARVAAPPDIDALIAALDWALHAVRGSIGYRHPRICAPTECRCGYKRAADVLDAAIVDATRREPQ